MEWNGEERTGTNISKGKCLCECFGKDVEVNCLLFTECNGWCHKRCSRLKDVSRVRFLIPNCNIRINRE